MGQNTQMGAVGTDPPVADVIRRYFADYPGGTTKQLLSDPNTALLAALVRQGEDYETPDYELEEEDATATYYADQYTVTASGPKQGGKEPENVDGAKIDLGEAFDAFDLRFTDAVDVAFQGPNNEHRVITYRAEDSPVVGKEAATRYIYVTRADAATSNPTFYVEAY